MSRQGTTNAKRPVEVSASKAGGFAAAVKPAPAAQTVPTAEPKLDTDAIRVRAFAIYQERIRTGAPGNQATDWSQAERELTQRR
jgi:hypothetical protein